MLGAANRWDLWDTWDQCVSLIRPIAGPIGSRRSRTYPGADLVTAPIRHHAPTADTAHTPIRFTVDNK